MTLTQTDLQSIKAALKPEFTQLNKKIDSLKRSNREDHNLFIDVFDKRVHKLEDRVTTLENKSALPAFKNL